MLTRIEISGFKSFEYFSLDLDFLSVIVGPNAAGKSNLFDAIRFLSFLAKQNVRESVRGIRGEAHELFHRDAEGQPGNRIRFEVEVLLQPRVRDDWGAAVELTHTRVAYELTLARKIDENGFERIQVEEEFARPISSTDDEAFRDRIDCSPSFLDKFLKYDRRGTNWLNTTVEKDDKRVFTVSQDGKGGRSRLFQATEATVLSGMTHAEFPHLFALREEIASWTFLQLDPTAMRRPGSAMDPDRLSPDGSNLASVLARIEAESRTAERPHGILSHIAAQLSLIIPGVSRIEIVPEKQNRQYHIQISINDGPPFSSRVVSDGTLRLLALLTILNDPKHRGLICLEEPENGLHPGRLVTLIDLLKRLTVDPSCDDFPGDEPLPQLLFNSHSPVLLAHLEPRNLFFADVVTKAGEPSKSSGRRTRIRPVRREVQQPLPGAMDDGSKFVTSKEIEAFLAAAQREGI